MKYALLFFAFMATSALADAPKIEAAEATRSGNGWTFSVTLSHPDTGWDHYADGWRVLAMDGTPLGTRTLHHPHVTEQPFTRSLSGVTLPKGTTEVKIQARDTLDGWASETLTLQLP